jgi:two-component system nitrate/nitrite response regulator NarL
MDVAVLEPRDVVRSGLATMLERLGTVENLESHSSIGELLVARQSHGDTAAPDIVIVSCVPNEDVVGPVRRTFPASRVLELVATEPKDHGIATKTFADGYLMVYDITEPVLDRTLQALMRGELPIPRPIANFLFERAHPASVSSLRAQPYFNASERNVIDLLLEGLSNRQIAQKLGISLHSAKRRVSAVLHKANSPSRAHFVAQMLRDESRG